MKVNVGNVDPCYVRLLPGIELKSVIVPGLSEVTVNTEHLLELVNGTNVLYGEVELDLHRGAVPEVVRPDLLVVSPPLEQVVQRVRHLECYRGSGPYLLGPTSLLSRKLLFIPVESCSLFANVFKITGIDDFVRIYSLVGRLENILSLNKREN